MFTLKFHNDWANNNMAGSNFAKSKIKISYETICFPFLVCGTRTRIYILVYDFKQTYCFQFWYHKIVILCLIFKVFSGVDPRIPQTGGGHPSRPSPFGAIYIYAPLASESPIHINLHMNRREYRPLKVVHQYYQYIFGDYM